jgi:hypothetical protein
MEVLFLILVFGIVLTNVLGSRYRVGDTTNNALPADDLDDTETTALAPIESDDIFTNPAYSYIPGNIYHHMYDDDLCTDPAFSFLACNIYHRDDEWTTDSSFDRPSSSCGIDD